jgi:hypothetical protein
MHENLKKPNRRIGLKAVITESMSMDLLQFTQSWGASHIWNVCNYHHIACSCHSAIGSIGTLCQFPGYGGGIRCDSWGEKIVTDKSNRPAKAISEEVRSAK